VARLQLFPRIVSAIAIDHCDRSAAMFTTAASRMTSAVEPALLNEAVDAALGDVVHPPQ
jgi:hypothetical protein